MACFGEAREAGRARDLIVSQWGAGWLDAGCAQLLPLFYRRWGTHLDWISAEGKRTYLANWLENRERMLRLTAVLQQFKKAGIDCVLLKGAGLVLRYYRDAGLRGMRDVDLLVPHSSVEAAADLLMAQGYVPDGKLDARAVAGRSRTRHAWQFAHPAGQNLDLHWRPLVRCYSPEIAVRFWRQTETVALEEQAVQVLAPTEQLFHVCAHGLQWDWVPQVRWVADALTVLQEPIEWTWLADLASAACMRVRMASALRFLSVRFGAPIPAGLPEELRRPAPEWERQEYDLLLKACPLGFLDSVAWHSYHFRRIRAFDPEWNAAPFWTAFPRYLADFLEAQSVPEFFRKLAQEVMARAKTQIAGLASRKA